MLFRTKRLAAVLALPALCVLFFVAPARAREWTDRTGQYSVEAKFLELTDDGIVRLQKADGRLLRIPLSKLCLRDQRYARQQKAPPSAAPSGGGPYWPHFHGPKGDNISTDTGLLKSWPGGGPKMIWEIGGLGDGFSSVAIADGTIYTAGNLHGNTVVTAIDLDGKKKWAADNGKAWTGDYQGSRGTPTVDGNRVYHENPSGDLVCLSTDGGEKIWGLNILEKAAGKNIQWALAESVLIDGDRLICCPCGQKASVVALNKQTGKMIWAARGLGDKAGYASPVLIEAGGLRIILTMTAKALIGVNAENGDLLFRHPHETKYDVNATDPIYHDGHIFISSGYGTGSEMLKLDVRGAKATVSRKWANKDLDNHHGGVVLYEGHLYGSNSGNKWICLDWNTGRKVYAEKGVGKGSLTLAEGMLYTLSENNRMGVAPAMPDGLNLAGEFRVPSGGGGKSWAHPVVCGGRLYIRHAHKLYVYDVKAK